MSYSRQISMIENALSTVPSDSIRALYQDPTFQMLRAAITSAIAGSVPSETSLEDAAMQQMFDSGCNVPFRVIDSLLVSYAIEEQKLEEVDTLEDEIEPEQEAKLDF